MDNVIEYSVGEHFIAALINGDMTGLNDDEIKTLERFERTETENLTNYHWSTGVNPIEHSSEFGRCEITGMLGNVAELHLVNMDKF
jgi:hypothetical protein